MNKAFVATILALLLPGCSEQASEDAGNMPDVISQKQLEEDAKAIKALADEQAKAVEENVTIEISSQQ